jgi:hypothetical protein
MTLSLVPLERGENLITFLDDGTASVVLFPFARELTEPERKRIRAACGAHVFVYACRDAPVPECISRPGTINDFPICSLRWAIGNATLLNIGILDVRQSDSTRDDLAKVLLDLDAKDETGDHRFIVTLVADHGFDVGEYISLHRPHAPHQLAVAPSLEAAVAGAKVI